MSQDLLFLDMADLHYLTGREREEELRVDTRKITLGDGQTERIETYRLVWRWYDRLIQCPYTYDEDEIIAMVRRCADHEGLSLDDAFARVVTVLVARLDREGIDITDDTVQLDIARQRMAKWRTRKDKPQGTSG